LLLNRSINHKINFILKAISLVKKVYNILRQEREIIRAYLDNIKDKDFICNNILQYVVFTLIVKKLDKRLRVCVNYRALNALIIKNCNTLLLIKETLQRLCKVKYYSEFDIIAIFNKIQIRLENKYKIAFITYYKLFKYVVILFKLCNVLIIF